MKKILSFLTICVVALSISFSADAKVKFGVKGGLNLTSMSGNLGQDLKGILSTYTGFHAGAALNVGLPLGFALQPEILYTQNGVRMNFSSLLTDLKATLSVASIQVPIGIQWGINLGSIRPYVQAVPYFSFPVSYIMKASGGGVQQTEKLDSEDFKSFDYGFGLGLGVDLWKLQVSAKYNWSLGTIVKGSNEPFFGDDWQDVNYDLRSGKLSGFELSVALFF